MAERPGPTIRRAYDRRDRSAPGRWILIDRLWPRGVARRAAPWDAWCKDVAPSTELRRWYGHDLDRFDEFARRYRAQLKQEPASRAVARLVDLAASEALILVTATRDVDHSGAEVLRRVLLGSTESAG